MGAGKLPNEVLEKILKEVPTIDRDDVLIGARMGFDTAHILFGDEICVVSTDPITGAADNLGTIGVNIAVNDIATSGAEPIGLLLTILGAIDTSHEEIMEIQKAATETANKLGVQIIGGHTEITSAVNQNVLSVAAIGRLAKEDWPDISEIKTGDYIAISKSIGLEGAAILMAERREYLSEFLTEEALSRTDELLADISVVEEGRLGRELGLNYMHDITEGGLLGAVYEASQALNKGIKVREKDIPLMDLTKKVAKAFDIDPLRLISSGAMLMVIPDNKKEKAKELFKAKNIDLSFIGNITEKDVIIEKSNIDVEIQPPKSDELYRALGQGEKEIILLATDNEDKANELRALLDGDKYEIKTKKDLECNVNIVEDGRNLEENALLKARSLANIYPDVFVLADDTGFYVDALDGEPGINAARYAGENCDYEDNCNKMLDELKNVENREAYFETAVAVITPDKSSHVFFGKIDGKILKEKIGNKGFGYDKIFKPNSSKLSFAQMSEEEKNKISHRRKALDKALKFIEK